MAPNGSGSHREYVRWRSRQIAYGRWQPWADAGPVREHVQRLRQAGASYDAIARAAGISVMTVHRLLHGCPPHGRPAPERISAAQAHRLLAVAPGRMCTGRRSAAGSRHRLRALVAIGHAPAALARQIGVPPHQVHRILGGDTRTVSPATDAAVRRVYDRLWNQLPPVRTGRERAAAAAARRRAERQGWPPPMALDDDRIDDPSYRPRARWRPATCGEATRPDRRSGHQLTGRSTGAGSGADGGTAS
jgi:hypothetical protein